MDFETFKRHFADKLRQLRNEKKISAREMSLSLGQNVNYINYIENGRHLPSMQGFFSICEYLGIHPAEFFEAPHTQDSDSLVFFASLPERKRQSVIAMIRELSESE